MFKTSIVTATAILMMSSTFLSAETTGKSVHVNIEEGKKGIIVEAVTPHQTDVVITPNHAPVQTTTVAKPQYFNDTIVYAQSAKKSYRVNEPILLQLKLKRPAHIYYVAISQQDNKGYLILPNDFESYNKYKANLSYVVPERSADYQFVSDRPGKEEIYIIATSQPISKVKLASVFKSKTGGVIPTATAKSAKAFVTKDIKVIAKLKNNHIDMKHFTIEVTGESNQNAHAPVQQEVNIQINP